MENRRDNGSGKMMRVGERKNLRGGDTVTEAMGIFQATNAT
jgi:hypothetical protein